MLGLCSGHQFCDDIKTGENDALTGASDMGEQTMLNRVVLGTVRRIVSDSDRNLDLVDQALQVFLEDVVAIAVAPSTIAEQENLLGVRVRTLAVPTPSGVKTVAGEFAGVVAQAEGHVPDIPPQIVEPVWDHHPVR